MTPLLTGQASEDGKGVSLAASGGGVTSRSRSWDGALRLLPVPTAVDLDAASEAAREFLTALGVRLDSQCLLATPDRMTHAYAEMLTPRPFEVTTFPNDEGYDELVVARSIPLQSVCEHHILPFVGVAHLGYIPGERVIGLSKLARVVEHFARRPQVQERLTTQIADWLQATLAPRGVGVVLEAEHLCMTMRGVRSTGASTLTSAVRGQLREDARSRAEFFALANQRSSRPVDGDCRD
ncbi:MAG: GTP cyclohydrolase I FolE [Chloroflexota bacterium]